MVLGRDPAMTAADRRDAPGQAVFQRQWQIYRKMVDHNYLFHREAYGRLHQWLTEEMDRPFRFLDIACGDASAAANALRGTRIAHYHGIDLSQAALALARQSLATLDCPVTLQHGDFVEVVRDPGLTADVAWVGLSLHHLQTPEKLAVMRDVRRIVGDRGHFLIYEDVSPDGEDREGWLRRWDLQEPAWTAYTPEEWSTMVDHVRTADYPETVSGWQALGRDAGFATARELFVAPSDLLRLYAFGP